MLYFTLKALHLACIALWFGALFTLCNLLPRLSTLPNTEGRMESWLQKTAVRLWRDVASPFAALAIVLGLVLMLSGHAADWVAIKLIAVAGLVLLHVAAGAWLHALQDTDGGWVRPAWLGHAMAGTLLVLFLLIAGLSSAKPERTVFKHALTQNAAVTHPPHGHRASHRPYLHRGFLGCESPKRP